jgi:cellulose biosynthesis protein BcsQ
MPHALREQVLAVADLVLLVCSPDSLAYACATRIASDVHHAHGPSTMIVLNGFDSSRRLDRDISVLLRTQHKQSFSPVIVHRDESLREALACKQMVFDFAPSSQSAYDFSALATWTLARLGHEETRA